jgi:hypothetical protein
MKRHVVIINSWPRYDESDRWDNSLVRFEQFIDHEKYHVSYIVNNTGRLGILASAESIFTVVQLNDLGNFQELYRAFFELYRAKKVDVIIALSEFHLLSAARLRKAFSVPGPAIEQVERYRDKVKMKQALRECDIRVPSFQCCASYEEATRFARDVGYPLVLKPRDGAASQGVVKIEGPQHLRHVYDKGGLEQYELEEFIEGDLFHVDGFSDFQGRTFTLVSQYYNKPLDFNHGQPVGSYLIFDEARTEKLSELCLKVLRCLKIDKMPFHMEAFLTASGEAVFLEIGARVGGADIPIVVSDFLDINLFELWMKASIGEPLEYEVTARPERHLGFLLIPRPISTAIEVRSATRLKNRISKIIRELVPEPGTVISDTQTYNSMLSGRFMFEGRSEFEMRETIQDILASFRIDYREIANDVSASNTACY